MGVWIETINLKYTFMKKEVTPFVGVWIETNQKAYHSVQLGVTPFVGVWIETKFLPEKLEMYHCHTLRGCVD